MPVIHQCHTALIVVSKRHRLPCAAVQVMLLGGACVPSALAVIAPPDRDLDTFENIPSQLSSPCESLAHPYSQAAHCIRPTFHKQWLYREQQRLSLQLHTAGRGMHRNYCTRDATPCR